MVSLAIFLIGSIVSATAQNFDALLVGRSFQGFGAGGAVAVADIVVTDMVELRLRGKWFGYLSIMYVVGTLSGPVIGGAFSEKGELTLLTTIHFELMFTSPQIYGDGYSGSIFLSVASQSC